MTRIDRSEGRRLFGSDPAAYDLARPGHPERVYELLAARCGLGPGAAVLEIGPGTGQATRRLLDYGASPLIALEPDPALAVHLRKSLGTRVEVLETALENARLPSDSFDLAVAASSFHWVDEERGLTNLLAALRRGGSCALWWTLFGDPGEPDAFITATTPLLDDLDSSPTSGAEGRPAYALDVEARVAALSEVGYRAIEHELVRWSASWDANGIRALYATFSPIARLAEDRRTAILDGIARIAEREFAGHVERTLLTSVYTARKPD